MQHLDLFSGIGGFALAARWVWGARHRILTFCEIDRFCHRVLQRHWPDVPIIKDIHTLDGTQYVGVVDLLTGGFPCQPYSCAGKRRGERDHRALWPQMFRVICEARPRWVLGENVIGFVSMGLDRVLSDLEGAGYAAEALVLPALAVNAHHRRDRVWIVGHDERSAGDLADTDRERRITCEAAGVPGQTWLARRCDTPLAPRSAAYEENAGDAAAVDRREGTRWPYQSALGGDADGLSERLDGGVTEHDGDMIRQQWASGAWDRHTPILVRDAHEPRHRSYALGNAIVPEVAVEFFTAMRMIDEGISEPEQM